VLAKRIIPCLDVKDGKVVKGVNFRNHRTIGDIITFATLYSDAEADELVFYDITASSDKRIVNKKWIRDVAQKINIPFTVAGGIRTLEDAETILNSGADKISINSPALENPSLINQLVERFGQQCVVIGIDSLKSDEDYYVYQYTGDEKKTIATKRLTKEWVSEIQDRGAGEIVLNCMNRDGVRGGYDLDQLAQMREVCNIPIIASGGAGKKEHFRDLFDFVNVDGALAATVFHSGLIKIGDLKKYLLDCNIRMRR